jgi:hypothetical protein
VLGDEYPDTLTSMHNLAFTLQSQTRCEEALALMEKCFQSRQQVPGEQHHDTQSSLGTLNKYRKQRCPVTPCVPARLNRRYTLSILRRRPWALTRPHLHPYSVAHRVSPTPSCPHTVRACESFKIPAQILNTDRPCSQPVFCPIKTSTRSRLLAPHFLSLGRRSPRPSTKAFKHTKLTCYKGAAYTRIT